MTEPNSAPTSEPHSTATSVPTSVQDTPSQAPAPEAKSAQRPRGGQRPARQKQAQGQAPRANPGARPPRANPGTRPPRAAPAATLPVLDQLAMLYPHLFGATFRPLKRGIFQDIQDANPEVFAKDDLKAALSHHTRSTRYLVAVAEGQGRRDLADAVVELMAPEHAHHALLEVFKRRQNRTGQDLRADLCERVVRAMDASGLSPQDYADKVQSRDELAQSVMDEAMAFVRSRQAREEALLRAYQASGQSVEAFADMYGMSVALVQGMLKRAGVNQPKPPEAA